LYRIREGKPGDAKEISRVHVDSWKFSYRGLVEEEFLKKLSYEKAVYSWEKIFAKKEPQNFIFVAEAFEKGLVGFTSGGLPRDEELGYEGEIYSIYVAPSWQGQGIGKSLLNKASSFFAEQEKKSFYLWTFASGKSRRFYEACGGQWKHQKEEVIGNRKYELTGYVWKIGKQ